jgi:hypothetical protein
MAATDAAPAYSTREGRGPARGTSGNAFRFDTSAEPATLNTAVVCVFSYQGTSNSLWENCANTFAL